jgi:hypothetical protein
VGHTGPGAGIAGIRALRPHSASLSESSRPKPRRTGAPAHRDRNAPAPPGRSPEVSRSRLRIGAILIGIAVATAYARWGFLHALDDDALAKRLLESRGLVCTPKIVERDDGVLRVVCADGKYAFAQSMPCSESFACGFLGFDAACWESVPLPTGG